VVRSTLASAGAICLLSGSVLALVWTPGVAAAATPSVTLTPAPAKGTYGNAENVTVSVGANSMFAPNSRVSIIECADPGGAAAHLPTSLSGCDEDTIQGNTVLVQSDGSFVEHGYTLYSLPNATLGEKATWLPVCDPTHQCVLYVGENQDDFTQPKIFSQPFAVTSTASTGTNGAVAAAEPATTPTTPTTISTAVSLPPATLAFTGAPDDVGWLVAAGLGMIALGILGRRAVRRSDR
jgi:hypothetical protein